MTERFYSKYAEIRKYVNRSKIPKDKQVVLAIADIFYNNCNRKVVREAIVLEPEIALLTRQGKTNWKERREVLVKHLEVCRKIIHAILNPNLRNISKTNIKKLRKLRV